MSDATRELTVQSNARRCPYCHDQVEVEARKVVCQDCLAVVHEPCWSEGGACPSCAGGRRLVAEDPSRVSATLPAGELDAVLRSAEWRELTDPGFRERLRRSAVERASEWPDVGLPMEVILGAIGFCLLVAIVAPGAVTLILSGIMAGSLVYADVAISRRDVERLVEHSLEPFPVKVLGLSKAPGDSAEGVQFTLSVRPEDLKRFRHERITPAPGGVRIPSVRGLETDAGPEDAAVAFIFDGRIVSLTPVRAERRGEDSVKAEAPLVVEPDDEVAPGIAESDPEEPDDSSTSEINPAAPS